MPRHTSAYNYCPDNLPALTTTLRVGISLLGEGKVIAEEGMSGALAKENLVMQTWIFYPSVIGVSTPMIGLLGTGTGMIKAFATLGSSGIGDQGALAGTIGEVLVATASGLVIVIPALGVFYFLRNRAADVVDHIHDVLNGLFRKVPYDALAGVRIGDDERYAAVPNWVSQQTADHTPGELHGSHAEDTVVAAP